MVWHVWSSRNSHADDYVPQAISQMNPIAASSRSVAADVPLTYMPADHPPAPPPPREWPYEHIVPGIPKNTEPYRGGFQKGHKRVAVREERLQQIQKAMDKMPQLIAEYRVS
jgi:hypothetical protein